MVVDIFELKEFFFKRKCGKDAGGWLCGSEFGRGMSDNLARLNGKL